MVSWRETQGICSYFRCAYPPGVFVGKRIVSLAVGVLVVWCDIENIVLLKNPCVLALALAPCAYALSGVAFLVNTR